MRRLAERLKSGAAQAFITTEKDAVKITPELRAILEVAAPVHVPQLRVDFSAPELIVADLGGRCR
jgi:tetraacyldisaccharide 4'-kinase